jgi:hypothetical protein
MILIEYYTFYHGFGGILHFFIIVLVEYYTFDYGFGGISHC